MEIISKKTPTAPKFMVYGLSGAGKTHLASQMRNSLVVDIEGGANYIDTPRTKQITNLDAFDGVVAELWRAPKREYDVIAIDTADWLIRLAVEKIAGITAQHLDSTLSRSNGGYGAGAQMLENYVRTKLLPLLNRLNSMGYGICLLAHADRKDLLDGDGTDVTRIAPKVDKTTLNAFLEWSDAIYYLKKEPNGDRTLVVESDDVALAKNRFGLTGSFNLSETNINDIIFQSDKKIEPKQEKK